MTYLIPRTIQSILMLNRNSRRGAIASLLITLMFCGGFSAQAQTAGDFRSIASGAWNSPATWERYDGSTWVPNFFPTNASAGVITIQSGNVITNSANVTADQIIVASGATLQVGAVLTVANGAGTDLDVSGTIVALSGSSCITLQSGSEFTVRSGGVFIHNGTSSTCVNNTASTLLFQNGARFIMQRAGATVPTATWNTGSTCEINYPTASTSRPGGLTQFFANFNWNNTNQNAGNDMANTLTNVAGGTLTVNAGPVASALEFKMFNASGSGAGYFGGVNVNAGRLNWASGGGPYIWSVRGNINIATNTAMDISGSASGSYTFLLDSGGVQNYSCAGTNSATKLHWTVATGTTLNLSNDLPITASGKTLTASGTVNLNGKTVLTDLVAGTGTIRNQGGGAGKLVLGVSNGTNTLDGTLALQDGASGTLGLVKGGNSGTAGLLTITAPQTFSGGLLISNGITLINNITGSGSGSGGISVLNGTLGGTGAVTGPVVFTAGSIAPGAFGLGTFTVNGALTVYNASIEVNKGTGFDQVVANSISYGNVLTIVTNGNPFVAGDNYQIFNAGSSTGNFTSINGTPGPNLAWSFNPTNGVLSVVTAVVTPPVLTSAYAPGTLTLSWTDAGFKLQSQTNNLVTGLTTNGWFDYPGGGTSPVVVNIDPARPTVFFRLSQ